MLPKDRRGGERATHDVPAKLNGARVDRGRDHSGVGAGTSDARVLRAGIVEIETEAFPLYDLRGASASYIEHCPVVHVLRGLGRHLPFLAGPLAAPLVCLSDWQYERPTQRHFWEQALPLVEEACGGAEAFSRALMLVAGDMASAGDRLRGKGSDAVPDLQPFSSSLGQTGAMYFVYGNHDEEVDRPLMNLSGQPQLLPDGDVMDSGRPTLEVDAAASASGRSARWKKQLEESDLPTSRGLLIGGVHGIPSADKMSTGSPWKKRDRSMYFRQVKKVCADADIVVLHSNPRIPGQTEIEGQDAPNIYDSFIRGHAKLLVHGHMHSQEVVTVVDRGKVIANCDCRVIVCVPDTSTEMRGDSEHGLESFRNSGKCEDNMSAQIRDADGDNASLDEVDHAPKIRRSASDRQDIATPVGPCMPSEESLSPSQIGAEAPQDMSKEHIRRGRWRGRN